MDVFNPFSLAGKQILITGASSGIGRAIAIACAKMGASVIITGRNSERLNETLRLMSDSCHDLQSRNKHMTITADLTKPEDVECLVENIPKLDGLVHSAGIGNRTLCKDITRTTLQQVFMPNVEAPILLQSSILSKRRLNRAASIVFIASRAAESPSIGNAAYSASKGAIISYAKCLALELAPRMIRVNCICPAMVWTNLILKGGIDKELLEEAQLNYPLKRYGQPEDIAYLALYILSDASSWMTGSSIDLTGGGEGTLTT